MKHLCQIISAVVLFFAATMAMFGSMGSRHDEVKTDRDGHVLVSLWSDFVKAKEADRPQSAIAVLREIIDRASDEHLAWDFYDGWRNYVDVSYSRDWGAGYNAGSEMKDAVEAFGEPVAVFCARYAKNYGAETDEKIRFVSDNAARLKASENRGFYSFGTTGLPDFLQESISDDYEYLLWYMLSGLYHDAEDFMRISDMLSAEVGESYPSGAYLEFCRIDREWKGAGNESPYEAFCRKYDGKAVALYARQAILEERFRMLSSRLTGDGAAILPEPYTGLSLSDAFSALRKECSDFVRMTAAFSGEEKKIAEGCTGIESMMKQLDSKTIGVEADGDTLRVILRNIKDADLVMKRMEGDVEAEAPLWSTEVENPYCSYYAPDTVNVCLPDKADGDYLFRCISGEVTQECALSLRSVSVAHRLVGDVCEVYIADYQSGRPLENVMVRICDKGAVLHEQTVNSSDGFVSLDMDFGRIPDRQMSRLSLRCEYVDGAGFLRMSPDVYVSAGRVSGQKDGEPNWYCSLYMDRTAFSPGDTVYFKGILYSKDKDGHAHIADAGDDVRVELADSRGKKLDEQSFRVGMYGSFAGKFILPYDGRNGICSMKVSYKGKSPVLYGNRFTVDDFVLPTFTLEFDRTEALFFPGADIEVTGHVTSFTGHDLSAANIRYEVSDYNHVISEGDVVLSADGSFAFSFRDDIAGDYNSYEISVSVIDATGEVHEFRKYLPVSNRFGLDVSLVNEAEGSLTVGEVREYVPGHEKTASVLDGEVADILFSLENSSGDVVADVEIPYVVRRGDEVLSEGTAMSGSIKNVDLTGLPSGEYRIEAGYTAEFVNAAGRDSSLTVRHTLIVLKLNEDESSMDSSAENVFKVIEDGRISLMFGAGSGPVWAVVDLWDSNLSLLRSDLVHLSGEKGEDGSLLRLDYEFLPEYTDNVALEVFYFRSGTRYSFSHTYRRNAEKTALPLEFGSFADRVEPGSECSFSLKTVPGAEVLVAVSDKSADYIRPNLWQRLNLYPDRQISPAISFVTGYERYRPGLADFSIRPVMKNSSYSASRVESADDALRDDVMEFLSSFSPTSETVLADGLRDDFRSTLAFLPFLVADEDGNVDFSFRPSDKISTYYVRVLAHDRGAGSNVIRRELLVTRDVMVSVQPPRYLYGGDKCLLSVAVSNSSADDVTGHLSFSVYGTSSDGEENPMLAVSRPMTVRKGRTSSENFCIDVTEDVLGLSYRILFDGTPGGMSREGQEGHDASCSDGVAGEIPVFPSRQRIVESHSAVLLPGMDRDSLYADLAGRFVNVQGHGAEYKEMPLLDMLYDAVPSAISVSGTDAVSLAKTLYACRLSEWLMSVRNPDIPAVVEVLDADGNPLDGAGRIVQMLQDCANPDGGLAWFPGLKSSLVITSAVLESIAGMRSRGLQDGLSDKVTAAVRYLDSLMVPQKSGSIRYGGISLEEYLYVRTMYPEIPLSVPGGVKPSAAFRKSVRKCLDVRRDDVLEGRILDKARRMAVVMRLSDSRSVRLAKDLGLNKKALSRLCDNLSADAASLMEYAVRHPSGGMYFPNAVMPYRGLLDSELYAHSMICDLLSCYGRCPEKYGEGSGQSCREAMEIADGIRVWILLQKETQQWSSDPAYLNAMASVSDGRESVGEVSALVMSQRFEKPFSDIKAAGNGFGISRKYYVERLTGTPRGILSVSGSWSREELMPGDSLRVGDKVIAVYEMWSMENRSFVEIDAPHPAALSLADQLSGPWYGLTGSRARKSLALFPWNQGYREAKKDRTRYYLEICPEKAASFEEKFFVNRAGTFVSPVVEVRCMYAPYYRANADYDGAMVVHP